MKYSKIFYYGIEIRNIVSVMPLEVYIFLFSILNNDNSLIID